MSLIPCRFFRQSRPWTAAAALLILLQIWPGEAVLAQSPPRELPRLHNLVAENRARVTALVVDLSNDRLLAALNPDDRLSPASVTKLYTAAAALQRFGPDHRFVTRLASTGDVVDGVLLGDLVLQGAGDPGLNTAQLWKLVNRLRNLGVERVAGQLVINESLFGSVPCSIKDRCQARNGSDNAYDSPLTAAGINFSTLEIEILPSSRPDEPAQVSIMPPGVRGYDMEGSVKTGKPGRRGFYRVRRSTTEGRSHLELSGTLPAASGPYLLQRSVAYPNRYTARVLHALLVDAGITVSGQLAIRSNAETPGARELVSVVSPTMAAQVRDLMAYSNNYIADTLTLDLAAYGNEPTPISLPRAAGKLEELARQANLKRRGWNEDASRPSQELVIDSGSGLSTSNRLSGRDIVALLAHMHETPADFPAFLGSLPVPEHTPSRMLKAGGNDWRQRLTAKTGTLTEPFNVRGLGGYFRTRDGGWGAFAFLVNGVPGRGSVSLNEALEALRGDMEELLAYY